MNILLILEESSKVGEFLKKRGLLEQYKKEKKKILSGQHSSLKLRQPKNKGMYYFRINKQFRAYGFMKENTLVVFKIDNHQNG
ncbi:hypothetical protein N9J72_00555 [Candidatus Gracilibacteria bacterium]|nr:hypothetical protein [Candidatus Gracilibacteria bacterium]